MFQEIPSVYSLASLLQFQPEEVLEFLQTIGEAFLSPNVSLFDESEEDATNGESGEGEESMDDLYHSRDLNKKQRKISINVAERIRYLIIFLFPGKKNCTSVKYSNCGKFSSSGKISNFGECSLFLEFLSFFFKFFFFREDEKLIQKFSDKQRTERYKISLKNRSKLPAWNKMEEILDTVSRYQVVVISGETGCGKSTQVKFEFIGCAFRLAESLHYDKIAVLIQVAVFDSRNE